MVLPPGRRAWQQVRLPIPPFFESVPSNINAGAPNLESIPRRNAPPRDVQHENHEDQGSPRAGYPLRCCGFRKVPDSLFLTHHQRIDPSSHEPRTRIHGDLPFSTDRRSWVPQRHRFCVGRSIKENQPKSPWLREGAMARHGVEETGAGTWEPNRRSTSGRRHVFEDASGRVLRHSSFLVGQRPSDQIHQILHRVRDLIRHRKRD